MLLAIMQQKISLLSHPKSMKKISSKGFTLVEMMLYVAICSFILISLATFFSFLISARIKNQTIAEVNQGGVQVLQLVTQTIRNAKSVSVPASGVSSSTLSIITVSTSTTPTIFDVASGTVRIKEGSGAYVPLTNSRVSISSLVFTNTSASSTDGGSVNVSFTISYRNITGRNEYSFSKTFSDTASFH
jgi:Tfp pilus assembly protein PilW